MVLAPYLYMTWSHFTGPTACTFFVHLALSHYARNQVKQLPTIMSVSFSTIWTQFYPPRGSLNESNFPSQAGKVFIVTGGSSGIGYALTRILYGAGGKVYMLTRSKERAAEAIAKIKACYAKAGKDAAGEGKQLGSINFIQMELMDFASVRSAAQKVLEFEGPDGRLDVLFNNAGSGARQNAPKSVQGHEYHVTTNTLGSFILTQHLLPLLARTAAHSPQPNSVRVVWPASIMVELQAPQSGIPKEWLAEPDRATHHVRLYTQSKVGCWFLASEFARRRADDTGVVFVAGNPGTYYTGIWKYAPKWVGWFSRPTLRSVERGAETYLWMGFSETVSVEDGKSGRYAICDGRWHPGQRADLVAALKGEGEGGSGRASEFFEWCEGVTRDFL